MIEDGSRHYKEGLTRMEINVQVEVWFVEVNELCSDDRLSRLVDLVIDQQQLWSMESGHFINKTMELGISDVQAYRELDGQSIESGRRCCVWLLILY